MRVWTCGAPADAAAAVLPAELEEHQPGACADHVGDGLERAPEDDGPERQDLVVLPEDRIHHDGDHGQRQAHDQYQERSQRQVALVRGDLGQGVRPVQQTSGHDVAQDAGDVPDDEQRAHGDRGPAAPLGGAGRRRTLASRPRARRLSGDDCFHGSLPRSARGERLGALRASRPHGRKVMRPRRRGRRPGGVSCVARQWHLLAAAVPP